MANCNLNWLPMRELPKETVYFCCNSSYILISLPSNDLLAFPVSEEPLALHSSPIASLHHGFADTFIISYEDGTLLQLVLSNSGYSRGNTLQLSTPIYYVLHAEDRLFIADEQALYLTDTSFSYCFSVFKTDRIVQISPLNSRDALVSTVTKTYMIKDNGVTPVGKKDRNGLYGACQLSEKIYASRPNGNIWEANTEGTVLKTMNYKTVQGGKVNFGLLYAWTDQYIISYADHSLLILQVSQQEIFYRRENVKLYFNAYEKALYILDGSVYCAELQTSWDIYMSYMSERKLDDAIVLVLSDPSLQCLAHLENLCSLIFLEEEEVAEGNYKAFVSLIDNLEGKETLSLPVEEFTDTVVRESDVDIFRFSNIGQEAEKYRKKLVNMRKALKNAKLGRTGSYKDHALIVEFLLTKKYIFMMIRNSLLDVILRLSQQLCKVQRFKKIARESFDYLEFSSICIEEKIILGKIDLIL